MLCHVYLTDNKLAVRAPFAAKDQLKAVPGARWNKDLHVWVYPPTPHAAKGLFEALPAETTTWGETAAALLVEAERIIRQAAHKDAVDLAPIPLTKADPAPWLHQVRGYHFGKSLPACMLAMQMRTGKTRTTIDIIQNRGSRLVLVVCPNKVLEGEVWAEQLATYCLVPHIVLTLWGGSIATRTAQLKQQVELSRLRKEMLVVCLNFEAIWRDPLSGALLQIPWDSVVLDESHRIKAPGGKAALFCSRLGDLVPHRMCLTGTPMAHSPLDVYAQYRFLDKGIFGTSFTAFRSRYAKMGGFGNHQVLSYENQEDLQRRFYSIAYRVETEDVLDLPEKQDITLYCRLSPYAQRLYRELADDFVTEVENRTVTASNALTRLLRLQQLTGGYLRKDHDVETGTEGEVVQVDTSKRELLAETLENLHADEPVVVYCRFHHDLDAVHEVAAALSRTSSEVSGRRSDMKAWQRGETTILAVQIQGGSEGNDFARAHIMFFYSVGFSLFQFEQAYMRIRSDAQKHACTYYYLIAKGTVDEQVYQAIKARQDVVESVLKGVRA